MIGIIPEGVMTVLVILLPIVLILVLIWTIFRLIGWYASKGSAVYCPYCNRKLYADHEYCPHCGGDLLKAEV